MPLSSSGAGGLDAGRPMIRCLAAAARYDFFGDGACRCNCYSPIASLVDRADMPVDVRVRRVWSKAHPLDEPTYPRLVHTAHVLQDLHEGLEDASTPMTRSPPQPAGPGRNSLTIQCTYRRHLLMVQRLADHDALAARSTRKHAARLGRPNDLGAAARRNELDELLQVCGAHSSSAARHS